MHPLNVARSVAIVGALMVAACSPSPPPTPTTQSAAPTAAPAAVTSPAAVTAPSPSAAANASPVASVVPSPSPAAPSAAAGPVTDITVAYTALIAGNLPYWYAADKGVFSKYGLNVTLQYIESSTAIAALLSNQVVIVTGGGAEMLSAIANGADLKAIGSTDSVYPFKFMVAPSIQSPGDLVGNKVGVSNVGSSSDIATRVALDAMGLNPDTDVTIIPVGSLSNRTAALLGGAIQGGVASPPDTVQLENNGFHDIFDMAANNLPSSQDSVITQSAYISSHPQVLQAFMNAVLETDNRLQTDKPGAIEVLQKYLQNDDQQALGETYDYFVQEVIPRDPSATLEQFSNDVPQLATTNPKVTSIDLNSVIDNTFARNALTQVGIN